MNQIKRLRELGHTKWRIAKTIGVSWQTVNMWEREIFKPRDSNSEKLDNMIANGEKR